MTRTEITKKLSTLIAEKISGDRKYAASEVTFDYGTGHATRIDFMSFEPVNQTVGGIEKGIFTCYEVKSSIEDFHSKNGHNFYGDKNYYVMPRDVLEKVRDEIPRRIGVYVETGGCLECAKRCIPTNRSRSGMEMMFCMFRSGMGPKYIERMENDM